MKISWTKKLYLLIILSLIPIVILMTTTCTENTLSLQSTTKIVPPESHSHKKIIYLVRHGEAYHNTHPDCRRYPDANLTPFGYTQAQKVLCSLNEKIFPELIVYSPMKRAIQTMISSLGRFCQEIDCLPLSDLQEKGNGEIGFDCDTGSSPSSLQKLFPTLNFSALNVDWMREGSDLPRPQKLTQRYARFRQWLSSRTEKIIVVVAHSGTITGVVNSNDEIGNGDVWKYHYDPLEHQFIKDESFVHYHNNISCIDDPRVFDIATPKF